MTIEDQYLHPITCINHRINGTREINNLPLTHKSKEKKKLQDLEKTFG
jgi:hypothetical protein